MNARVFLLALVTAAFMAIWDADRPVEGRAALAQSKLQNVGMPFANAGSNRPPLVAAEYSHKSQNNAAASGSINEIVQTFRRYNYDIISKHEEDNYLSALKERSEYLEKYLSI